MEFFIKNFEMWNYRVISKVIALSKYLRRYKIVEIIHIPILDVEAIIIKYERI